jgi:hypothetical protein
MQVHGELQATAAWWLFAVASYHSRPTKDAAAALAHATADLIRAPALVDVATRELMQYVERVIAEDDGGE